MAQFTVLRRKRRYFSMNRGLLGFNLVAGGFNLPMGGSIEKISVAGIGAAYLGK